MRVLLIVHEAFTYWSSRTDRLVVAKVTVRSITKNYTKLIRSKLATTTQKEAGSTTADA